jgi:hypothetical protein
MEASGDTALEEEMVPFCEVMRRMLARLSLPVERVEEEEVEKASRDF